MGPLYLVGRRSHGSAERRPRPPEIEMQPPDRHLATGVTALTRAAVQHKLLYVACIKHCDSTGLRFL